MNNSSFNSFHIKIVCSQFFVQGLVSPALLPLFSSFPNSLRNLHKVRLELLIKICIILVLTEESLILLNYCSCCMFTLDNMESMDSSHDYYMSGFLPLFYRQVIWFSVFSNLSLFPFGRFCILAIYTLSDFFIQKSWKECDSLFAFKRKS